MSPCSLWTALRAWGRRLRLARWPVRPGIGLRQSLATGYGPTALRADIQSGVLVGLVAIPLSMALAIAAGLPPQHGLYSSIVAGLVAAVAGGSRFLVTGPSAAFVVILAPLVARHGFGGLFVTAALAGLMLVAFGLSRMGRLIQFIPYPVVTGFTAGIAVVLATLQVRDFLGLTLGPLPPHLTEQLALLAGALDTLHWPSLATGLVTLVVLTQWGKISRHVPPLFAALGIGAVLGVAFRLIDSQWAVQTIGTRFDYVLDGVAGRGIPQALPAFVLPWSWPMPQGGALELGWPLLRELLPAAFALAILGAMESLLSAVVADGITGEEHDPDTELFAQGLGNFVAPFFGGMAATGALARTALNVRSGARSPVSGIAHALFVLVAVVALAPLLRYLPMAALAAVLLVAAWNMSEARHFWRMLRTAPQSDVAVLMTCFLLTIFFDMIIAVGAGVTLASFLFMRRMAEVSDIHLVGRHSKERAADVPPGVLIYEIGGALFFGAAQKAMSTLRSLDAQVHTVVLNMHAAPAIDTTGMVNLQSTIARLKDAHIEVLLADLQPQPQHALCKAGWYEQPDLVHICATLEEALEMGRKRAVALGWTRGTGRHPSLPSPPAAGASPAVAHTTDASQPQD